MSADQIVILILLIALVVKFIFFENRETLHNQIRQSTTSIAVKSSQTLLPNEILTTGMVEQTLLPYTSRPMNYQPQSSLMALEPTKRKTPLFTIDERTFYNVSTQTDALNIDELSVNIQQTTNDIVEKRTPRPLQECLDIFNSTEEWGGATNLTDEEITAIINAGGRYIPLHKIESVLDNPERGVRIRRKIFSTLASINMDIIDRLPYQNFDYHKVMNTCCENVLGYMPIPVGFAGPLLLDGAHYFIPMATTEGALVASTNRGCKALSVRGVTSYVEDVGMTRAPCVRFPSVTRAAAAKNWINEDQNYKKIKTEFDSTSRFGRLKECLVVMDGPQLYIRFVAFTGDAMGMNMVSKGSEIALKCIKKEFPDMQIISLSGNFCCDKKPAAINWIKGRGKRVVTECIISAQTLRTILKTEAKTLVDCNKLKNMTGSALAGTIGGKLFVLKYEYLTVRFQLLKPFLFLNR